MTPVKYTYNALGLLVSETQPLLGVTRKTSTYDNRGRLVSESNAVGTTSSGTTYYTYDIWDRLTQTRVTNTAGTELYRETTTYIDVNSLGYQIVNTIVASSEISAPSIHTYVGYNIYGEKVGEGEVCANGSVNETTYYYDYVGNLLSALSPMAVTGTQVTNYSYTSLLGQPQSMGVTALGGTTALRAATYFYDSLGRNTATATGNNTYIQKTYDALNRQLTEQTDDMLTERCRRW